MKTLLLLAKFEAIQEKSEEITITHVKSALLGVEVVEEKFRDLLYNKLEVKESDKLEEKYTQENIETAKSHPTIKFDTEVKALNSYLEDNELSLSTVATKIYVNTKDDSTHVETSKNTLQTLREQINKLEEALKSKIYSQDNAIEALCDKVVETTYNQSENTPKAIFLFLGPPATGKTMLAEMMSKYLDDYESIKVFDMTRYSNEGDGFGLFGLEKGYTNAKEGSLTSFVKKNPKSILVFDEFEKAAPEVMTNFLALLSKAEVEDQFTKKSIDFRQTIVIFTSNLGKELYSNSSFLDVMKQDPMSAQSTIIETISREKKLYKGREVASISPELLSRLSQGNVILFNKLSFEGLLNIAKNILLETQDKFERKFNLTITYEKFDVTISLLLLSFAPILDIRRIKSQISLIIFDRISDFLIKNEEEVTAVNISLEKSAVQFLQEEIISLSSEQQDKYIKDLFRKNETFQYEVNTVLEKKTLNIIFSKAQKKKLPKSIDMGGQDGIVFEMPDIAFKDIAGHEVAKNRLHEIINILKESKKLEEFNLSLPRGMLLYGPPGTGKTMLAKAFSNEAELPFIATTGSEILDISRMKKIFKRAKEYAPAIVFIDEIDAIGRRDGSNKDIIINQFLTEINGFSDNSDESIFIIAATNLKEKIDPAIVRSGRIDLHVEIDQLDKEARAYFINEMLKKPTKGGINIDKLITYTAGMTGADLEKVSRESSLYIFRNGLDALTEDILVEQINIIKYGERITHKSLDEMLESTAIHEAGHAIISRVLMPEIRIEQVTVAPRGDALGFVSYDIESDVSNLTKRDIKNKILVAFAGRVAQLQEYGEEGMDSGASNDLKKATWYAHYAIATLGMDEEIGYINISSNENLLKSEIDKKVQEWLKEGEQETKKLVQTYWQPIKSLSQELLKHETVNEEKLNQIIKEKK